MNKRVLFITYDFPPVASGISTYFSHLWKGLNGVDVFILAPRLQNDDETDRNYSHKVLRYQKFFGLKFLRVLALIPLIALQIKKHKIDTIFCGVPVSLGFLGRLFKNIFGLPYAVFYYGGEFDKFKKNVFIFNILKQNLKQADAVITISDFTTNEVLKFDIKPERITKITPGIDTDKFRPGLDISKLENKFGLKGKAVLLTVARLVKRKGIDSVIMALPKVIQQNKNIKYLIVGVGSDEKYFRDLVRDNRLSEYVEFVGMVSDGELPLYYNACDIFVMPNKKTYGREVLEGFGISFLEASSCQKPVIGGLSGGSAEAVVDGKTGLLIDSENIELLAELILRLINNQAFTDELAKNARVRAEKEFNWRQRSEQLGKIIFNI
ncbi:MAG: glycosyltransferase family 4 protein [Candidatus Omnitrophica bacterium]|nr:glycosyltransferase family 4 protein [Candidatus Omnitrophota bacterium]